MKKLKWDNPELIRFTNAIAQGLCTSGTIAHPFADQCLQGSAPGEGQDWCNPGGLAYWDPVCASGGTPNSPIG